MNPPQSILVVDDEEDVRRFLASALRRAGYEVVTADSAEQALALLERARFSLVITDLRMPGMDGLELLRRIATQHPQTRGIVLTGYGSIQGAVEATKLGADNYVTKPIVVDKFIQTVRDTLERGQPLRAEPSPTAQVSTLAALTRLLAQPAPDLREMLRGSAEILASMLQGNTRLSVIDPISAAQLVSVQASAPARLARPDAEGRRPETANVGQAPHALTINLEPSHGYRGVLEASRDASLPAFTTHEIQLLQLASNQLSIALGNLLAGHSLDLTLRELRELSLQTVRALVRAAEMRDHYTAGHSARVSRYAVALARSLGLDPADVENLRVAALLHDVGKVGISDLLLNKPGPLSPVERARIEEHPALGCQIISGVQSLAPSLPFILHHQERYDGLGYPDHLTGEQIPYGARILAVADSFEAITATRAYRKGRSIADAREILAAGSGQQWDPLLVARWLQIIDRVLRSEPAE